MVVRIPINANYDHGGDSMSAKVWVVAEGGQQKEGKHSTEEIAAMVSGNPKGKFLVWKEGMAQWVDPRTLPEFQAPVSGEGAEETLSDTPPPAKDAKAKPKPKPKPKPAGDDDAGKKIKEGGKAILDGAAAHLGKIKYSKDTSSYLPHLNLIDALLGWVGKILSADLLDTLDEWAKKFGHFALILSALLLFFFDVLAGIKIGSFFSKFLMGLLIIPVILILQYLAYKFLDAGKALIKKSPSNISTNAFFQGIALLLLLGVLGTFFGGLYFSIATKSLLPVGMGLGAALILTYSLGVALNRETVNMQLVDDASAGQEAIGILSFFLKLELRIVPFIFGVVNVLAPLALLYLMVMLLISDSPYSVAFTKANFQMYIIWVAMLPFVAYLSFLISYLIIDLIRSILIVPDKLDQLREGGKTE